MQRRGVLSRVQSVTVQVVVDAVMALVHTVEEKESMKKALLRLYYRITHPEICVKHKCEKSVCFSGHWYCAICDVERREQDDKRRTRLLKSLKSL